MSLYDTIYWTDMVQIAASEDWIIGLRRDGTVRLANREGGRTSCTSLDWKDIVAVFASAMGVYGVESDGVLHAFGSDANETVKSWRSVVYIGGRFGAVVAQTSDGRIFDSSHVNPSHARNPVALIFSLEGDKTAIQLSTDGKPHIHMYSDYANDPVFSQMGSVDELAERRMKERAEDRQRMAYASRGLCSRCGGELKDGLFFSKTCSKCGAKKDY